jgi:hypothetical protein
MPGYFGCMKLLILIAGLFFFRVRYRKHTGRTRILFFIRPIAYSWAAQKKLMRFVCFNIKKQHDTRRVEKNGISGDCIECKQDPATNDYNGHGHYVCDHCYKRLNDYFDEEYD